MLGTPPAANAVVVGPRESLARTDGRRRAAGSTPTSSGSRRSSATAHRPSPATVEPTPRGFRLELDEPAYGVAPGQAAVLYDGDAVVGYGTDHAARD